jgi:hypothetical protein
MPHNASVLEKNSYINKLVVKLPPHAGHIMAATSKDFSFGERLYQQVVSKSSSS